MKILEHDNRIDLEKKVLFVLNNFELKFISYNRLLPSIWQLSNPSGIDNPSVE